METKDAAYWIRTIKLQPHPEGGHYRETYRSDLRVETIEEGTLKRNRSAAASIHFLLEGAEFSAFHRLLSDEVWYFHVGSTFLIHILDEGGGSVLRCGPNPEKGDALQVAMRRGTYFAAELEDKNAFGMVGCIVAPGFEFKDFEIAERRKLLDMFPASRDVIMRLSRG